MAKTPRRIYVTLPAGTRALLDQLIARDLYGTEHGVVAKHLIIASLDRLVEQNRLIDAPSVATVPDGHDAPEDAQPRE
jgi:hypothetical protein